jgi:hypothetical protein
VRPRSVLVSIGGVALTGVGGGGGRGEGKRGGEGDGVGKDEGKGLAGAVVGKGGVRRGCGGWRS